MTFVTFWPAWQALKEEGMGTIFFPPLRAPRALTRPSRTRTLEFPPPLPTQASSIQHGMIHRSTRAATIVDQKS